MRQIIGVPRRPRVRARAAALSLAVPPASPATDTALLAPRPGGRPGLRTEAGKVRAAARACADLSAGLGMTPMGPAAEERVVLEVDPRAALAARSILNALPEAPRVAQAAGTTAEVLGDVLGKFRGAAALHLSAEALDQAIADSLAVLGALQRRLRGQVRAAAETMRATGPLSPPLRAALGRMDEIDRRQRAAQAGRAEKTSRERRAADAQIAEAGDRVELLRTMIGLREGEAVPGEAIDAAAEAAGTGEADAPPERRAGDR